VRACWAPPGVRPAVRQQLSRKYLNAWATVSPRDGRLVFSYSERCNSVEMSAHLRAVARAFPRDHLVLFVDGAGWHRSRDLVVPARIHLHYLPPYSPELNPTEQIWDHLRENYTANFLFDDLFALEVQVRVGGVQMKRRPDRVRSLTLHGWIDRAARPFGKVIV
jgi:transposase